MSTNTLFWEMQERGKRWRVRRFGTGPILGIVSHNFYGWEGIVCFPDKKWPDSQKSVRSDRRFWSARRAVEYEIDKGVL